MNRSQKINLLASRRKAKKMPIVANGSPFIDAFEDKVNKLTSKFDKGVSINSDELMSRLEQVAVLNDEIKNLHRAIRTIDIPSSVKVTGIESLLRALDRFKNKEFDLPQLASVNKSLEVLIKKIDKIQVPEKDGKGQTPSDFIPMRRVVKVQGVGLLFDDSFYTGGGGGGGNSDTTAANQTTANNLLSSIDTKLTGHLSVVDQVYKKLIDDTTTTNVTYIGEAALGTATSAASWRVKKVDESSSPTSITWSGTGFTAIWDNRTSLTYT